MAICEVCFRRCNLAEGQIGVCQARKCEDGRVVSDNYGKLTAIALDPIEKKPLARFHPGSMILSVGSYGCNLKCPFCQNYEISQVGGRGGRGDGSSGSLSQKNRPSGHKTSPEELLQAALDTRKYGNIGVAFTYNEPMIGWEYVRDCARLIHNNGMRNVLVTNGTAQLAILEQVLPYIDAMNIDLKSFSEKCYREVLKGDLGMTKAFIERAVQSCHVELTTLIVPGMNDSEEEMREMSAWIRSLPGGAEIPLHISRFFPRYHMMDRPATDIDVVYRLAELAREQLTYVYTGNC